jgi:hypothetical protein
MTMPEPPAPTVPTVPTPATTAPKDLYDCPLHEALNRIAAKMQRVDLDTDPGAYKEWMILTSAANQIEALGPLKEALADQERELVELRAIRDAVLLLKGLK